MQPAKFTFFSFSRALKLKMKLFRTFINLPNTGICKLVRLAILLLVGQQKNNWLLKQFFEKLNEELSIE